MAIYSLEAPLQIRKKLKSLPQETAEYRATMEQDEQHLKKLSPLLSHWEKSLAIKGEVRDLENKLQQVEAEKNSLLQYLEVVRTRSNLC